MIKHIVFFKLSAKGRDVQDDLIKKLNNLQEDIAFIRGLEVGVNFAQEDRAFDISLIVLLDDKKSLSNYASHPKHFEVVSFIKSLNTKSHVVDYEIDEFTKIL